MNENTKNNDMLEEEALEEPILEESIPVIKIKKSLQAKGLVEETEAIVNSCNEETQSSKLLLENDLHEYETAEASLRNGGLEDCILLLEQLGYTECMAEVHEEENFVTIEKEEEVATFEVKDIKSGRFTGIIYGILAAMAFAVSLVYLATEKLGLTLDITEIPSSMTVTEITSWFSVALGLEKSMLTGTAILILASLAMMVLIYMIRVSMRANYNVHFAQTQLEQAQVYKTAQGLSKWEMGRVEEHMRETLITLKLYEVIFTEQKMKLKRILYIEGAKSQENEYHSKSLIELKETKNLIEMIEKFMSIPISKEGKLVEKSVTYLEEAKVSMNKVLSRFYG